MDKKSCTTFYPLKPTNIYIGIGLQNILAYDCLLAPIPSCYLIIDSFASHQVIPLGVVFVVLFILLSFN